MKVYLIGAVGCRYGTGEDVTTRINYELQVFRNNIPVVPILEEALQVIEQAGSTLPTNELNSKLDDKIAMLASKKDDTSNSGLSYKLLIEAKSQLHKYVTTSLAQWDLSITKEADAARFYLIKIFREPLQRLWIAWEEDWMYESTMVACNNVRQSLKDSENLLVVLWQEAVICDHTNKADYYPVYYSVAKDFFSGNCLQGTYNIRRNGMKKVCLKNMQRDFQTAFSKTKAEILQIPGTVIWMKEKMKAQEFKETDYNTALVFWNNECIFAWDKQLVSLIDGHSGENKYMRKLTVHDPDKNDGIPQTPINCTASKLTSMIMLRTPGTVITPIFQISPFGHEFSVGLCICRDAMRPDILCADVDMHILVGAGASYQPKTKGRVRAKQLYLFCDGMGAITILDKKDDSLWKRGISHKWENMDDDKVEKYMNEVSDSGDVKNVMYLCKHVGELEPNEAEEKPCPIA